MTSPPPIGTMVADRFRVSRPLPDDAYGPRAIGRDRTTRQQVVVRPWSEALPPTVDHPAVVQILHSEPGWLVTEWDRGDTLAAEQAPLMSSTVQWMHDIASALEAIHASGTMHGSIVPMSIRLVPRSPPPASARLDHCGLPLYGTTDGHLVCAAPEVLSGAAPSSASDVYGLGVTLFEALTGGALYPGPVHKVMEDHRSSPVPIPSQRRSGIPKWLDDLTVSMLAKKPEDRPPASEVARRLLDGVALLRDGAAHPEHITANVAPKRLPNVAIRGSAAHHPRRIIPRDHRTPPGVPARSALAGSTAAWGVVIGLSMTLVLLMGYLLFATP